jgi:hypothetical protein
MLTVHKVSRITGAFLIFFSCFAWAGISIDESSGFYSRQLTLTQNDLLADGNFFAEQSIDVSCSEIIRGRGRLKAPTLHIVTKNFAFTGTIECSGTCEIISQEPFNQKMFKRKGPGRFIIKIDPSLKFEQKHAEVALEVQKPVEAERRVEELRSDEPSNSSGEDTPAKQALSEAGQ